MYNHKMKRYCCMNNQDGKCDKDALESACQNEYCTCSDYDDDCGCGFDEEENIFPQNPMLGQSYVPIQYMDKTFKPSIGLKMGTIYPELVSPYGPGQSMREMAYLSLTNKPGEGCNTCRRKITE